MNLLKSIVLLVSVRYTRNATERTPSFTDIPPGVIFLSGVEVIWIRKYYIMDEVVLKMLEELDTSRIMGGFNYNKCMEILYGFRDEILNEIGGDTGGTSRECYFLLLRIIYEY